MLRLQLGTTKSDKVIRRIIESAYEGETLGDLPTIERPKAIDEIRIVRQKSWFVSVSVIVKQDEVSLALRLFINDLILHTSVGSSPRTPSWQ